MPRPRLRPWIGAAIGLASVGWGANQFTSLIVLYRRDLGLPATATAAMFGLYAIGLVPGLLLGGRWSDRAGRRVVVAAAVIACGIASAVLMLGAVGDGWLYLGRLLAGIGAGLGFSAGTAWVVELSGDAAGARRATVAVTAGFAAGPGIAGLVAAVAPLPEVVSYVPHLVAVAVALPVVLVSPDSRPRSPDPELPSAPGLRSLLGHYVAVQLPLAPWVFGSAAVAIAFLPAIVTARLGGAALVITALLTALTPICGILAQPIATRVARSGRRPLIAVAMAVVVAGIVVAVLVAGTASPALAPLASVVLGLAFGLTQFAGLREVHRVADPRALGVATAIYQVLSYVGFAFPLLLSSLQAASGASAAAALLVLVAVAALCLIWLTAVLPRTRWGRD